ncbi:DUF6310 domain-containing protein [Myxococcus fulvus]|uniref:DUF6310 domain-containing protein n=1 Tax=Myxococcus fulvus TaxID=33 RepID=UPI0020BD8891|nr:DUF6310 domain-containing protein [Myxococcus fulvus]MCK8501561.1 DUF6310 domain-containing protein [Myxococcus fulvus]
MRLRACITLLLFLSACATSAPSPKEPAARNPRIANLQRAAKLPWTDGGRCVVREASQPWPVLAERCFQALDHDRIRFNDPTGRCAVASAGAAALGIGLCVLAAPEIVVGAVIVVGVVVVGVVIKEALDAYELRGSSSEEVEPAPQTKSGPQAPSANQKPKPEPSGQDWFPPVPTEPRERERRPECVPKRVPPKGGNALHNWCADNVPFNAFRGANALVNGKAYDALQPAARTLWEVKTTAIETYSPFVQRTELQKQVEEGRRERDLAAACGYDFVIGVRTEAHRQMLKNAAPDLKVVLMTWCK